MNIKTHQKLVRTALLSALRQQEHKNTRLLKQVPDLEPAAQRRFLGDLLIASNAHWKKDTLDLIDQVYKSEEAGRQTTSLANMLATSKVGHHRNTRVAVWRGDITTLEVDAIVNAANSLGLGCFVPHHRCIDNVIHRAAGPRLRLACEKAMKARAAPLEAGTAPIVTEGYFLPSSRVIHVTGPRIPSGHAVTPKDEEHLRRAYQLSLDAAASQGLKTIAFPCISTGLFGYPAEQATRVALSTTQRWLEENPGVLDAVVFDVFTEQDQKLYEESLESYFASSTTNVEATTAVGMEVEETTMTDKMNRLAKTAIEDADAILICAGAGMSVKEGEMVYTNQEDFAHHYPYFAEKWGYRTAYEAMGLFGDRRVPATAKWAFWANHLNNMRFAFAPNQGYGYLKELVGDKDHFVVTSNVDGCFERAGFDPKKIYTPQGDYGYLQCMNACQSDSVYDARPYLQPMIPRISAEGRIPENLIPHCPRCGGDVFGNVRGGSWFLHHNYDEGNKAAIRWMREQADAQKKVVVIEVGAGFNTPMVTRWPMESFVRETGGTLIRINPSDPEVPSDVKALSYDEGWRVLGDILEAKAIDDSGTATTQQEVREHQADEGRLLPKQQTQKVERYMGHFDWRRFLKGLSR